MSSLGNALMDSLMRLRPPGPGKTADLKPIVQALADALERGELAMDLSKEPPEGLDNELWPEGVLHTLESSGWLVNADALDADPQAPIVQDGDWLRWRRWHQQLQHCLTDLLSLAAQAVQNPVAEKARTAARQRGLQAGLDQEQCDAVIALLDRRLVVLTGGPGTGKTSTVVQMLAAVLHDKPDLRIQLTAPTGKAAARLQLAIAEGCAVLEPGLSATLQTLPSGTLHKLLEAQGDNRFRRNASQPLSVDLVVVDEVSMVDLPLMTALLAALPTHAQLLLVGDADQLPPVGPGAVLQELTTPANLAQLGAAAVQLKTTYRNNGAIAALAADLREGNTSLVPATLRNLQPSDNVQWIAAKRHAVPTPLLKKLQERQKSLKQLADNLIWVNDQPDRDTAAELLEALESWIALSPVRQGPWGVEALNRVLLGERFTQPVQAWPPGTPVLNRHNRPEQGLTNGDIGVVVQHGHETRVLLPGGRVLHPAQFSGAEPAFALTVHKAQGSQYDSIVLLLPPQRRQDPRLAYTGLTRAKHQALLITPDD